MKILKTCLLAIAFSAAFSLSAYIALPKTTILGTEYYMYEAQKGESIYGVAKAYNWDMDVLSKLNPNLKSPLDKGDVIYYPADVTPATEAGSSTNNNIPHDVKRGETVYSIAHFYKISVDDIYKLNPDSRYGIKAGSTLLIPGKPRKQDSSTIEHIIQSGETLYGVAKRYNTSIKDILRENPGVSESNFRAGDKIRILPDSRLQNLVPQKSVKDKLVSVDTYKVKRNDTWEKVARKHKVDVDVLKQSNPNISSLEKDMVIVIPMTVETTVTEMVPVSDPRESSVEGRQEIYEEVSRQLAEEAKRRDVRIAVVADDIESNKDNEFIRGFVAAIDQLKDSPYKIALKVVDGSASPDALQSDLSKFKPTLVFTTADKNFPTWLTSFGEREDCYIVNVFDSRDESYLTNFHTIQLMTPSGDFNRCVSDAVKKRFHDYDIIVVGDNGESDPVLTEILQGEFPSVVTMDASDIENYDTTDKDNILIYANISKRNDVKDLLDHAVLLRDKTPEADVAVLGKPNWVTHQSQMSQLFNDAQVFIPSRFFFDSDLSASREFINNYKEMYQHTPIKSYPVYAVTGYDAAKYFIPLYSEVGDDLASYAPIDLNLLQNDFKLRHPGNDQASGWYNPVVYLIKFNTFGNIDKIILE